jgi:opacity protein-like surface antigen
VGTKNIIKTLLWVLFLGAQLFGQATNPPAPAVTSAATLEASAGYAYISLAAPNSQRVGLNGLTANVDSQFTPHWGGTLDFTFARAGDVLGTGKSDTVSDVMIGPVFYPFERGKTALFVHALVGIAWIHGAVPITATTYYDGWEDRPSFALGAGVERSITGPFAVRATVDYLHTTFASPTGATEGQNDLRLTATFVYRF